MTATAPHPAHRALWRHWGTPAAVYGTVVYSSLIAAASVEAEHAAAGRILLFSVTTIVVFWLAHVFSVALAHHGDADSVGARVRDSLGHALFESSGMLEAAIVPSIPLVLSVFGLLQVRAAVVLSLWCAVVVLALLGYLAFRVRDRPLWVRLVGAAATALFGVAVVALEALLH
ncbi:hypothetical protein P5G50_09190 [Leifsonia sp. F6_8S_P_1B]|uniref:Yip1 domain-containing protein n=1 Tax=Leifsonia williamsii TaxID=3035919 RepID=A0ABT8KDU6_9MICO|nr:hypothetical protein [Leifsonia williamsii]MDN4614627.1 hypothetical protein [Leifsonia williamsii]